MAKPTLEAVSKPPARMDILIRPSLGAVRFMEFDRAEEIIEIGYRSAAEQLAKRLPQLPQLGKNR